MLWHSVADLVLCSSRVLSGGRNIKSLRYSREGYEEYEVDKDAWLIDKGYDKHVRKTDPRTIPRVTTSYEVTDPTDPNGKVGEWIERESKREYESRCETRFLPFVFEVHGGCTGDTAREIRHLLNAWSEQNGYDETRCAVNRHAWRPACLLTLSRRRCAGSQSLWLPLAKIGRAHV